MRAIVLALEDRVGEQVDPREPIAQFIPEFAAFIINRLKVGKDGKTAAERCKGKKATVVGLEFGEKVLWKKVGGSRAEKFRGRWDFGIFIGVRRRSGEFWMADKDEGCRQLCRFEDCQRMKGGAKTTGDG